MMYYTLSTNSGKEYKLKLTAQAQVELKKELGRGIMDAFGDIANSPGEFMGLMLWQSAQKFEHGFTKRNGFDLYDELVEDGKKLDDFTLIAAEILGVSGFFGQETLESIKSEMSSMKM